MTDTEHDIPNKNSIVMYHHCGLCLDEKPDDITPADWSRTQSGWTELGLQVWCNRHSINIIHIDFEKHQHPANLTTCIKMKIGDIVTRLLAGTVPHELKVTDITDTEIICGAWKFDKATGAEIDEDLNWGPPPLTTGSFIKDYP